MRIGCLGDYLDLIWMKRQEARENCIIWSFIICTVPNISKIVRHVVQTVEMRNVNKFFVGIQIEQKYKYCLPHPSHTKFDT